MRVMAAPVLADAASARGLVYSTTTSPASRPKARAARLVSRSLWLPGAVKPPADWSRPKTPVPQTAAKATHATASTRIRRRRR